jgi:acyl carrier protein
MTGTPDDLRDWLIKRVAYYTGKEPADVDPAVPLTAYGLDSVYALTLCGEIEDHLSVRIEPTIIWDFRTVDDLLAHLKELLPNVGTVS